MSGTVFEKNRKNLEGCRPRRFSFKTARKNHPKKAYPSGASSRIVLFRQTQQPSYQRGLSWCFSIRYPFFVCVIECDCITAIKQENNHEKKIVHKLENEKLYKTNKKKAINHKGLTKGNKMIKYD